MGMVGTSGESGAYTDHRKEHVTQGQDLISRTVIDEGSERVALGGGSPNKKQSWGFARSLESRWSAEKR